MIGTLVFAHPEVVPRNGTEVVVTYLDDSGLAGIRRVDPIQALRGRGRGERLVEKLLQARREDRCGSACRYPVSLQLELK